MDELKTTEKDAAEPGARPPIAYRATQIFCQCGEKPAQSLIEAAEHGCINCCRRLLKGHVQADGVTNGLMRAAELGQFACMRELVKEFGGKTDEEGRTALHHALFAGELNSQTLDCARALAADPRELKAAGTTRLMSMTLLGTTMQGASLAQEIKAGAGAKDKTGKTALHYAARLFDIAGSVADEAADFIGDEGDIKKVETQNQKPKKEPNQFAAGLLVGSAAAVLFTGGSAALYFTLLLVCGVCWFIWKKRFAEEPAPTPVAPLNLKQSFKSVQSLLDALIPLEAGIKDNNGRTAMMEAARAGGAKAVEKLAPKECGMADREGKTALWHTIFSGSFSLEKRKCTQMLQAHGAELENSGITQLMMAGYLNAKNVDVALLDQATRRDVAGNFALLYAVLGGSTHLIQLLLEKEAGMQTFAGVTALMVAAEQGNVKAVQLLLPKEGGKWAKDDSFALQAAILRNRRLCAESLWGDERERVLLTPELRAAAAEQFGLQ